MAMGSLPPFEDREAYGGFFPALFQTWVGACFRPMEFFASVGNGQNLGPALLFGIIVGWVSIVLSSLASVAFKAPLSPLLGQQEGATEMFAMGAGSIVFSVLLGWAIPLWGIFVGGLIVHLFLLIFGGAKQGLTMTLRVISYAYAPQIFVVVPLLGACVAVVWTFVLETIGLASAHRTDTWRAALAVLAPIFLGICCFGAVVAAYIYFTTPVAAWEPPVPSLPPPPLR